MLRQKVTTLGWLLKNHQEVDREKQPLSHLFLDGGRLAVPDSSHGVFLNTYVNALLGGDCPCAVELRTPVFALHFDVDAKTASKEDPWKASGYCLPKFCHNLVSSFFNVSRDSCHMIVCSTMPKCLSTSDEVTLYKHGMHIIWPNVLVTSATALAFRKFVLERLDADDQVAVKHTFLNNWNDILDECVFTTSGLRMVWSAKGPDDARAYLPVVECQDDIIKNIPAPSRSTVRQWVHLCSIRRPGGVETCVRPEFLHLFESNEHQEDFRHMDGSLSAGTIVSTTSVVAELEALRKVLPEVYHTNCRFHGLYVFGRCVIVRSTSHYCHCAARCHRSNTAYFVIRDGRGVSQRCWDIECKGMSSPCWYVPDDAMCAFMKLTGGTDPPLPQLPSTNTATGETLAPVQLPSVKRRQVSGNSTLNLLSRSRIDSTKKKKKKKKNG